MSHWIELPSQKLRLNVHEEKAPVVFKNRDDIVGVGNFPQARKTELLRGGTARSRISAPGKSVNKTNKGCR